MTVNKRFTIDVEETTQENALFENGKFVCFEDDTDEYLKKINEMSDENERLRAQLYCDFNEGVCIICKHHYLEKGNLFYISKCEKGHEECSTDALKHCKDFELKELEND